MIDIILVVHVLIAVSMIGVILLQRSEGGGLGIGGGGGGGMSGFMTGRGTATFLNKVTVGLAVAFMVSSIVLSILAGNRGGESIIDDLSVGAPVIEETVDLPSEPAVPLE